MGGRGGPFPSTNPERAGFLLGRSKGRFHSPNLFLFLKHLVLRQCISMCSSRKTLFSSLVHNRAYVNHRSKQMVKSLSEIREPTHTHTHTHRATYS